MSMQGGTLGLSCATHVPIVRVCGVLYWDIWSIWGAEHAGDHAKQGAFDSDYPVCHRLQATLFAAGLQAT